MKTSRGRWLLRRLDAANRKCRSGRERILPQWRGVRDWASPLEDVPVEIIGNIREAIEGHGLSPSSGGRITQLRAVVLGPAADST